MVSRKCTVCDSPNATNYHFGARSCKACAAFFRRSIAMKQRYECLGDGINSCKINYALRLNCRRCRLNKCLNAGMMKDLVQAKKEIKLHNCRKCGISEENTIYIHNNYETHSYSQSDNEWGSDMNMLKDNSLMEYDELQQYITIPNNRNQIGFPSTSSSAFSESDDFSFSTLRSRLDSISQWSSCSGNEPDEKYYCITAHYIDLLLKLNSRRKITYTNTLLDSIFDNCCVCPYQRSDLKLFDYRTYRQKNRNDYTMILDYVNQFPEFELLTRSEKSVLFRTAAAVDLLVDQFYYSERLFEDDDVLVTTNGEYFPMNPLPMPENAINDSRFKCAEDFEKYKSLTSLKKRQWLQVVIPLKKLKMTFAETALFKALTIWHHNYYKMQENGRKICVRQRDDIINSLFVICTDEGYDDPIIRVADIITAIEFVMQEIHEMVTSYIEITVFNVIEDPILSDMLKFQY